MSTTETSHMGLPQKIAPPKTEEELMERAQALAGRRLADVAAEHLMRVPENSTRSKGWAGQLLERALGATAGSLAEPDFQAIHVEMKSLPIDRIGTPVESTYVCVAPLDESLGTSWRDSWVFHKLARVLWVPLLSEKHLPPGERVIGTPFIWSPSPQEEAILRDDWETLSELILTGQVARITGSIGQALHLRPKASSSAETKWAVGEEGEWIKANPKGFYLRSSFTQSVLAANLAMPTR